MIPEELKNTKVRVNGQMQAKVITKLFNLGFRPVVARAPYGLYLTENGGIIAEPSDVVGTDFKQRTEYREITIDEIMELRKPRRISELF